MTNWYILCSFGTLFRFWYHVPRKIWQPCLVGLTEGQPTINYRREQVSRALDAAASCNILLKLILKLFLNGGDEESRQNWTFTTWKTEPMSNTFFIYKLPPYSVA
jgi:hypothetical protein